LVYEIDPPDTSAARDLLISIKRGDITQSSFGFSIAKGGDKWGDDRSSGTLIRTVLKVGKLYDVSPVSFPAYPQTDAAQRSMQEFLQESELMQRKLKMGVRDVQLRAIEARKRFLGC
jgi:HK97 family phage prohead protease